MLIEIIALLLRNIPVIIISITVFNVYYANVALLVAEMGTRITQL